MHNYNSISDVIAYRLSRHHKSQKNFEWGDSSTQIRVIFGFLDWPEGRQRGASRRSDWKSACSAPFNIHSEREARLEHTVRGIYEWRRTVGHCLSPRFTAGTRMSVFVRSAAQTEAVSGLSVIEFISRRIASSAWWNSTLGDRPKVPEFGVSRAAERLDAELHAHRTAWKTSRIRRATGLAGNEKRALMDGSMALF